MKEFLKTIVLTLVLISTYSICQAQRATEIYIPVGQSPGVSGLSAVMGTVKSIDLSDSTITIEGKQGTRVIRCAKDSKIWFDKTKIKQSNKGSYLANVTIGSTVEVKYKDNTPDSDVEWIKIQLE